MYMYIINFTMLKSLVIVLSLIKFIVGCADQIFADPSYIWKITIPLTDEKLCTTLYS